VVHCSQREMNVEISGLKYSYSDNMYIISVKTYA